MFIKAAINVHLFILLFNCLVLHTLSDGGLKQNGLCSNTTECDAPFQGAGVAGSTVM